MSPEMLARCCSVLGPLSALVGGCALGGFLMRWLASRTLRRRAAAVVNPSVRVGHGGGVVRLVERCSDEAASGRASRVPAIARSGAVGITRVIAVSGLSGRVSAEGVARARMIAASACAAAGAVAGSVCSAELAVVGIVAGGVMGWTAPMRALRAARAQRTDRLEGDLSRMIEVLCLGLHGGLSFDAALSAYCRHFDGVLATEMAAAHSSWINGLATREAALRALAATYDSALFGRFVDNVVRSMRFGSPLAEGLAGIAEDARKAYRARVQERVMKAPVKMMVPVGTLILPSMLLLVLGPVLLELMEGF